jgi:hypothetical protein
MGIADQTMIMNSSGRLRLETSYMSGITIATSIFPIHEKIKVYDAE